MTRKNRRSWLARSAEAVEQNVTESAPAAGAGYTIMGAILVLGGIGYAVDRWQGTSPWWMLAGLALGLIVGFYELAKIVWPR